MAWSRKEDPVERKPFAITLDPASSLHNHTGNWRTKRPVYVSRLAPCNHACPAGENIQGWLYLAEEGRYEEAWRELVKDNPMPAIHGRVCYHPCESACNRAQLDEAVSIHAVERFLGDLATRNGWRVQAAPATGRRVLVVGAGPSGLSAAYHLALMGHAVEVFDAGPKPGGMMRFGIPKYRLPREVLDGEVARIEALGVRFVLNRRVDDLAATMRDGSFDAVFLAVGAQVGRRVDIPSRDARRLLDAVGVLRAVESGAPIQLGRRVAVYGGGNTAIDAARTAKRLGAEEAVIIYRRDRAHMSAREFEVAEALEEGVTIRWLESIAGFEDGRLRVETMELDSQGRPVPTGRVEDLAADTVLLAVGQQVDTGFLRNVDGLIIQPDGVITVDDSMMTGHPGVFAGGDMVPSNRTVTVSTGHGRVAARHIDAWLKNARYQQPEAPPLATFDRLNTWYYTDAAQAKQPVLPPARRQAGFDEVVGGLDEATALLEARRCLSCGNCFRCDNCYGICPDNAVIKLDPEKGYAIDYDFCKGCGMCAKECPCGAIDMIDEKV
jgi:2-oxoacid:acceptor oxidoreductase delta subunit (pyruvate/2-ketoisovalerate family)